MPTSDISKFLFDFLCPNRALDKSTINSYQSTLRLENFTKKII